MNRLKFLHLLLTALLLALGAQAGDAESTEAVRKRMESNLPKIDALKKAGKVGETNEGYLEARTALNEDEKSLVSRENADRKTVYTALAERAKVSLEQMERARAELIRKRSTPGIWLQDSAGEWYRK